MLKEKVSSSSFLQVVLQFETSGKWPDDLTAIQHIKAAFHIRLAKLLKSECSLVTAASPRHVDVLKVSKQNISVQRILALTNLHFKIFPE